MAKKILNTWYRCDILPEVIIPVPLSTERYRMRGYNQSALLGYIISRRTKIPLVFDHCYRIFDTKMQAKLSKEDRRLNLQGAFVAATSAKHVALLDDVVTTTNTVRAVSLALQKAGVEQVDVWTICRG